MNTLDKDLAMWMQTDQNNLFTSDELIDWIADFDADRQLVISKLGPYQRVFLRPDKFTKRFYHQLMPLPLENWRYERQINLYANFCRIELSMEIRFQASLQYAERHLELLAQINQHIKSVYTEQIDEIVNRELQVLDDGLWVRTGLIAIEKQISLAVCELLTIQQIQAQALSKITAKFADFPMVQPGKERVYLQVLKKSFEEEQFKAQEISRQQRLLEQQALEEKQLKLEQIKRITELELEAQALEAEKHRRLLEEKQDQLVKQLAMEKQIYADQIQHQAELKAVEFDSQLLEKEQQQAKIRLAEIKQLKAELSHETALESEKLQLAIARRESLQAIDLNQDAGLG